MELRPHSTPPSVLTFTSLMGLHKRGLEPVLASAMGTVVASGIFRARRTLSCREHRRPSLTSSPIYSRGVSRTSTVSQTQQKSLQGTVPGVSLLRLSEAGFRCSEHFLPAHLCHPHTSRLKAEFPTARTCTRQPALGIRSYSPTPHVGEGCALPEGQPARHSVTDTTSSVFKETCQSDSTLRKHLKQSSS